MVIEGRLFVVPSKGSFVSFAVGQRGMPDPDSLFTTLGSSSSATGE